MLKSINGKIVKKGHKWFTVELGNHKSKVNNYLLVTKDTDNYNVGDSFSSLWVNTRHVGYGNKERYYHTPKRYLSDIVLRMDSNTTVIQPKIGSVFEKNGAVFQIYKVITHDNGKQNGFVTELWLECVCKDITYTDKGQKLLGTIKERYNYGRKQSKKI